MNEEFIQKIGQIIKQEAELRGYKFPSAIIAQACLESAYGKSSLAYKYHNYFGMKCGSKWTGASVNMTTKEEYTPGTLTTIKDNFRAYSSIEEGVKGYFDFISAARYQNLKEATSSKNYLELIKQDGYATSSAYVNNVYNVVLSNNLLRFDGGSNNMKATEFIEKLKNAASLQTYYVQGCFGAYLTNANIARYLTNTTYNKNHAAEIQKNAIGKFGFDCVCLIKGILWGFNADKSATYGGAKYKANGVADIGADQMINVCKNISEDFKTIIPGEAVWLPGHIGVYIGNGLVVECTPAFNGGVQITACGNIGKVSGYNTRTWKKHGQLPYIEYDAKTETTTTTTDKSAVKNIIKLLQTELNKHGYGLAVDGDMGPLTIAAYNNFKASK